jgi:hypothetical protein
MPGHSEALGSIETLLGRVMDHAFALGATVLVFGHDSLVSRPIFGSSFILRQELENSPFCP